MVDAPDLGSDAARCVGSNPTIPTKFEEVFVKFDTMYMDENNRMVRIGFGKNNGKMFFRVDFWFIGFRVSKKEQQRDGRVV